MKSAANKLASKEIPATDEVINLNDLNPDTNQEKIRETKNFAKILSRKPDVTNSSEDTDTGKATTANQFLNRENEDESIEKAVDENTPTMAAIPDDND